MKNLCLLATAVTVAILMETATPALAATIQEVGNQAVDVFINQQVNAYNLGTIDIYESSISFTNTATGQTVSDHMTGAIVWDWRNAHFQEYAPLLLNGHDHPDDMRLQVWLPGNYNGTFEHVGIGLRKLKGPYYERGPLAESFQASSDSPVNKLQLEPLQNTAFRAALVTVTFKDWILEDPHAFPYESLKATGTIERVPAANVSLKQVIASSASRRPIFRWQDYESQGWLTHTGTIATLGIRIAVKDVNFLANTIDPNAYCSEGHGRRSRPELWYQAEIDMTNVGPLSAITKRVEFGGMTCAPPAAYPPNQSLGSPQTGA